MRGAFAASQGDPVAMTAGDVRARARCSVGVAWRVVHLRQCGSPAAIALWLEGALTLRQVEQIVTQDPCDAALQAAAAARCSPVARAILARGEAD